MSRTDTQTPTPASPDPGKKPVTPMKPGSGLRPTSNVVGGAAKLPTAGGGGGGGGSSGGGASPGPAGGMPPIDQLQGRPIGRVLTKMGKVTREQVVEALTFQKSKGGAIGRILIDLGYIKEGDLNTGLAAQRGYEWISLEGVKVDPAAIAAVPAQIATTNKVLPLTFDKDSKRLTVVMA